MNTMIINPMVVQIKQNDLEVISPIDPTMHKGGVGKILSIAVAIAIPIAAPTIATSMGVSGFVSSATGWAANSFATGALSGAITGAALGAVSAVVQGQNVGRGALMHGITSGVTGGMSAPGGVFDAGPTMGSTTNVASATTPIDSSYNIDTSLGQGLSPADAVFGPPSTSRAINAQLRAGLGETINTTSMGEGFMQVMGKTGTELKGRFTDPRILANMTLDAGGRIAGALLIPEDAMPELPPEFKEAQAAYTAELQELKNRDEAAFNQKMELSKQYLVNAGYLDPVWGGNQAANDVLIRESRKIEEGKRTAALTDWRTDTTADDRRAGLDISRGRASAFDRGYGNILGQKLAYTDAGLKALPAPSDYNTYARGLGVQQDDIYNMYNIAGNLDKTNQMARSNLQSFIGGIATGEKDTKKDTGTTDTTDNTVAQTVPPSFPTAGIDTTGLDNLYKSIEEPLDPWSNRRGLT